jgi:hypothetical protein
MKTKSKIQVESELEKIIINYKEIDIHNFFLSNYRGLETLCEVQILCLQVVSFLIYNYYKQKEIRQ